LPRAEDAFTVCPDQDLAGRWRTVTAVEMVLERSIFMPQTYCPQKPGERHYRFCNRRTHEIIDVLDRKAEKLGLPQIPSRDTVAAHLRLAIPLFNKEKDMGRPWVESGVLRVLACRWVAMVDLDITVSDIVRIADLIRNHALNWQPLKLMDEIASRYESNKKRRAQARRDLHALGWAITLYRMRHLGSSLEGNMAMRAVCKLIIDYRH
jgi:hypothetical protein